MNQDLRMKAFLEQLVKALAAHPEQGEVRLLDGRRATRFEIHLPAGERGPLIGKEGSTIKAIRTLAAISAHRHRRRFEVEIAGPGE